MERFVLDNSIVMAWCFEDESNAMADAVLEQLQTKLAIVPTIWPLEVGVLTISKFRVPDRGSENPSPLGDG